MHATCLPCNADLGRNETEGGQAIGGGNGDWVHLPAWCEAEEIAAIADELLVPPPVDGFLALKRRS